MPTQIPTMYATEVRHHLLLLGEERVLAHEAGLDHDRAYMADLEDEIATYRSAYTGASSPRSRCSARGSTDLSKVKQPALTVRLLP